MLCNKNDVDKYVTIFPGCGARMKVMLFLILYIILDLAKAIYGFGLSQVNQS